MAGKWQTLGVAICGNATAMFARAVIKNGLLQSVFFDGSLSFL